MKITDQSQTGDVLVSFVEDDDGHLFVHWLALKGGAAMVFVAINDEPRLNRIHSFVIDSIRPIANSGAPAQGASFFIN